ncbi:hypothetical protein MTO96_044371 [Rhipicephalus appendiculatus]
MERLRKAAALRLMLTLKQRQMGARESEFFTAKYYRMTPETFEKLHSLKFGLTRDWLCREPISSGERLAMCLRCGQLHPKEANPTRAPVCIICEGPHLSGIRECKHRHLPNVTRPTSAREARSQQRVDHTLPGASAQRSEPPASQRDGQSKSSNRPTWADKLKTPKGTRTPVTNTPPAPDPP